MNTVKYKTNLNNNAAKKLQDLLTSSIMIGIYCISKTVLVKRLLMAVDALNDRML